MGIIFWSIGRSRVNLLKAGRWGGLGMGYIPLLRSFPLLVDVLQGGVFSKGIGLFFLFLFFLGCLLFFFFFLSWFI